MADGIQIVCVFDAAGLALLAAQAPDACPWELSCILGPFWQGTLRSQPGTLGKLTPAALDRRTI